MAVPKGYKHNWAYRGHMGEKKLRKGLWKIRLRATKRTRAKGMGEFKPGTTGAWKFIGIQYIRKTGRGTYQTDLIGYKKPLRFNVKRGYKRAVQQKRNRKHRKKKYY